MYGRTNGQSYRLAGKKQGRAGGEQTGKEIDRDRIIRKTNRDGQRQIRKQGQGGDRKGEI